MENGEKRFEGDHFLEDRISSLPDSLIDCILGRLTDDIGAVVRTSVLSKRWRFCWTRVRKLNFDIEFLNKYAKARGLNHVVNIVDSILSRHDGLVDQFSLYFNTIRREDEEFDICRWMKVLSEKEIREISFNITPPCYVGRPSSIFGCSTLTHLSLYNCDFGLSSEFCGFTNLVSLHLEGVIIPRSVLETVISNSPLLKDLELTEMCIEENDVVVINAPGLQTLSLNHMATFCLKELPNLTAACLDVQFEVSMIGHGRICKLDKFAQVMPRVESLTLAADALSALAVGNIPMKLPTTLENLKHLELDEFDILSVDQLSCAFCLIRSSPSLQSLEIFVNESSHNNDEWEAAERCYEAQEKVGNFSCLSRLKFDNLLGADYEVKFISASLNCCPKVQTVLFSTNEDIESESEDWLLEELEKLPSPEATNMKFHSHSMGRMH